MKSYLRFLVFLPAIHLTNLPGVAEEGIQFSKVVPYSEWRDGAKFPAPENPNQLRKQDANQIRFITFHETETSTPPDREGEIAVLNKNVPNPRFGGIAYHFLIGNTGTIYQGRPLEYAPASGTFYYPVRMLLEKGTSFHDSEAVAKDQEKEKPSGFVLGALHNDDKKWNYFKSRKAEAGDRPVAPGDSIGHITIAFLCNSQSKKSEPTFPSKEALGAASRLAAELLLDYKLNTSSIRVHREVCTGTTCPGPFIYQWIRGESNAPSPNERGPAFPSIEREMKRIVIESNGGGDPGAAHLPKAKATLP